MAVIKVGTFILNHINTDLFADTEMIGANFSILPDKKSLPRITVGVKEDWQEVYSALMHEAFEGVLIQFNRAYNQLFDSAGDAGRRMFFFDHADFSEIVDKVAFFFPEAVEKLHRVYVDVRKKNMIKEIRETI